MATVIPVVSAMDAWKYVALGYEGILQDINQRITAAQHPARVRNALIRDRGSVLEFVLKNMREADLPEITAIRKMANYEMPRPS